MTITITLTTIAAAGLLALVLRGLHQRRANRRRLAARLDAI